MALACRLFGIPVTEISIGNGPVLFRAGTFVLRLVPLGGYCKVKDTIVDNIPPEDAAQHPDAFNMKSRAVQVAVLLSGSIALLVLAVVIHPQSGIAEFHSSFRQLIVGALSPLGTAQRFIGMAREISLHQGFITLLGILAAIVSAINLFPFPSLNGGKIIIALLRSDPARPSPWEKPFLMVMLWPYMLLGLSWIVALVYFFVAG